MNKDKRKALIKDLTDSTRGPISASGYVRVAVAMADAASQGRTDRWKAACRNAGEVILDVTRRGDRTQPSMRKAVEQGLSLMADANK